jgi:four helix bundle protein
MNPPLGPNRLLSRFVAYQTALEAFRLTAIASRRWRGFRRLVDQALGAAGSVAHNLAEGNAHPPGSDERRRYQRIALGSALELESALEAAEVADLGDRTARAAARAAAGRSAALCTALCRR